AAVDRGRDGSRPAPPRPPPAPAPAAPGFLREELPFRFRRNPLRPRFCATSRLRRRRLPDRALVPADEPAVDNSTCCLILLLGVIGQSLTLECHLLSDTVRPQHVQPVATRRRRPT